MSNSQTFKYQTHLQLCKIYRFYQHTFYICVSIVCVHDKLLCKGRRNICIHFDKWIIYEINFHSKCSAARIHKTGRPKENSIQFFVGLKD